MHQKENYAKFLRKKKKQFLKKVGNIYFKKLSLLLFIL